MVKKLVGFINFLFSDPEVQPGTEQLSNIESFATLVTDFPGNIYVSKSTKETLEKGAKYVQS